MSTTTTIRRDCVIAAGGPAGVMLGYLLARTGLNVTVLEKHADLLRDFRGDTIHPSTIALLRELGISEEFRALLLSRVATMDVVIDGTRLTLIDFVSLPEPNNFLVFAPQWDFLNFIASKGRELPGFDLRMSTSGDDLLIENGRVVGVRATGKGGDLEICAPLTVAADGRTSTLRTKAGMHPADFGAPIDVLWFHLPKPGQEPPTTLAYLSTKGMVLTLDREEYYQAGMVIPKGRFAELQQAGLAAFRDRIAASLPRCRTSQR